MAYHRLGEYLVGSTSASCRLGPRLNGALLEPVESITVRQRFWRIRMQIITDRLVTGVTAQSADPEWVDSLRLYGQLVQVAPVIAGFPFPLAASWRSASFKTSSSAEIST